MISRNFTWQSSLTFLAVIVMLLSQLQINAEDSEDDSFFDDLDIEDSDEMDNDIDISVIEDFLTGDMHESKTIEFVLNHYKSAIKLENSMDKLFKHQILVERDRKLIEQIQAKSVETNLLLNRVSSLIMEGRLGQIDRSGMRKEIFSIYTKKTKLLQDLESIIINGTSVGEIQAFYEEKKKMHQDSDIFTANKNEYIQHMMLFPSIIGIDLDQLDLPNYNGEFVEFDVTPFVDILKLYKRVDSLQEKMKTLQDSEKKLLEEEIRALKEEKIPELKKSNQDMLNRYFPSYTGIAARLGKKLLEVDKLYTTLKMVTVQLEKESKIFLDEAQQLNDELEEAASIFMKKEEL